MQTYLVQRVAAYLSRELETNVSVGGLDVTFFLNMVLEDVQIEDRRGLAMVQAKRMVFDIGRVSFRHRFLSINKLFMEGVQLNLKKYAGESTYSFQFFVDYFSDNEHDETQLARKWDLVCKSLAFDTSSFSLHNENGFPTEQGFDIDRLHIDDFKLNVHDILLTGDTLSFIVDDLSLRETRGFGLEHLSGNFSIGPQQTSIEAFRLSTSKSQLSLELMLSYQDYESLDDFFQEVELNLRLRPSKLNLADVGFYIPSLYGMENMINLQGEFSGRLSDLNASNFFFSYGKDTNFKGNFRLSGLPEPDRIRFNFLIERYQTSVEDIASFRLPQSQKEPYLTIPENVFNLGLLSYRGRISGTFDELSARGLFQTGLGDLNTDLSIIRESQHTAHVYKGNVSTTGFDLGSFFSANGRLGIISLDADVEGQGLNSEALEMMIAGKVNALEVNGYRYENLDVSGTISNSKFNGLLKVDDKNLNLDFLGVINFEEAIPVFDFHAHIRDANLTALKLYQRDENASSILSTEILIKASGGTLDDLQGKIDLTGIRYEERFAVDEGDGDVHIYTSDQISLENTNFSGNQKHLLIRSDFIDASLSGEIFFEDLLLSVKSFFALHIPSFLDLQNQEAMQEADLHNGERIQNFQLKVLFKNTDLISDLFVPAFRLSRNSTFYIDFNSESETIDMAGRADVLTIYGNRMNDWNLTGKMSASGYQITNQSTRLMITDSIYVNNFCMDGILFRDTLWYEANWSAWDPDVDSYGYIGGFVRFFGDRQMSLRFLPSYAMVNDSKWQINEGNEIFLDSNRIEVANLQFYNEHQLLKVEGVLSPDPGQRMHVFFQNFAFANMDAIVRVKKMNFDGVMDGMVSFTAIHQPLSLEARLQIDTFVFNGEQLGDLFIESLWDESSEGFQIGARLAGHNPQQGTQPLIASGYFYPDREDDQFDLDIMLDRFSLSVWSPFLEGILDDFQGFASGKLRLEGPAADPGLSGTLYAENAGFRIDYLNTRYAFAHDVIISKNAFTVDYLQLSDSLGNYGYVSGTVRHNKFRDFYLDVLLRPEQMIVLNTNASQNDLYYGKAFATGILHIHGPDNDIVMDISARTNRGTQLFLPLVYTGEVVQNHFISFVSSDTTVTRVPFPEVSIAGLSLNFDLNVTPDAEVQLIFDSQIGDVIRGRGAGNLKLEITSQGAFNMYGEYNIQEGDYLFTLQNLINKRFRIEQGGSIRWSGDPEDADIDLRAAYRLRTSLYDLMMDVDTSDFYRRRVPVECILILKDNLVNPNITFDIQLPGGDEGTRELIERRITTEQEMNRQVFSLLILNRFMPTTTDQYNTALGYGVGSTSSELLSNQLSNWLSQISNDFDIGVNYRPGDEISSQELEVALSTQLFNDRVLIDGNVGVAGHNPAMTQRTSNIIGDVNVEVKITPEGKFRVKAFNRSNTFDIINLNSPYTQGLGVFYRKEFDSLSELFRRSVRKENVPELLDIGIP